MRRAIAAALALLVLAVAMPLAPSTAGATTPGVRYLDPVFPAVDHTFDIEFSAPDGVPLELDFYEPRGDVATARPLLLWFHGGTFIDGDKITHRADAEWFARRGYAVASVNYSLRPDAPWRGIDIGAALADPELAPGFQLAVVEAWADARAAIAHFRTNAARYRIDPGRISTIGFSAGAVIALGTAYFGPYSEGFNGPWDLSRLTGVAISYAGIGLASTSEAGEPASLMLHGERDAKIPYTDAEDYCRSVRQSGASCTFEGYPGDHGITSDWNWEPLHERSLAYLYEQVIDPPDTPVDASLHGQVVGGDHQPLHAATVSIRTAGGSSVVATATTDASGRWSAVVPPGAYDIKVAARDHVSEYFDDQPSADPNAPLVLSSGQQAEVDVLLEAECPDPPSFPDVVDAATSCGAVEWMVERGMTTGYEDGTFRPAESLTRQAFVAFLHRLHGSPLPAVNAPYFIDVPPRHPFATAIRWAAGEGIVGGFPDHTFRPTAPLSRQAFAAFVYRLMGEPQGPFPTPGFVPVAPEHPFFTELEWLWSTRYEAIAWRPAWPFLVVTGAYAPTAPVSRQSVAATLHRMVGDIVFAVY